MGDFGASIGRDRAHVLVRQTVWLVCCRPYRFATVADCFAQVVTFEAVALLPGLEVGLECEVTKPRRIESQAEPFKARGKT